MNTRTTRISAFQDNVQEYASTNPAIHSLTQTGQRATKVRVNNPNSDWFEYLGTRFNVLVSLPAGWDGYNGKPVSFTCAQFAANLIERLYDDRLAPPDLVPGSDGTLQIEWHRNQYDIEIDILAPYQVVATRFDHLTGREEEVDLSSDFTILGIWLSDLNNVNRAAA